MKAAIAIIFNILDLFLQQNGNFAQYIALILQMAQYIACHQKYYHKQQQYASDPSSKIITNALALTLIQSSISSDDDSSNVLMFHDSHFAQLADKPRTSVSNVQTEPVMDNTWSFRQLKSLFYGFLFLGKFKFMIWSQAALIVPLKNAQQIKQKVYRQFFEDAQIKLKQQQEQAEVGLMKKIVQQLKKYLYQCYYMRGFGYEEITDDLFQVMRASKRQQQDQIICTRTGASYLQIFYTQQKCKINLSNNQQELIKVIKIEQIPRK